MQTMKNLCLTFIASIFFVLNCSSQEKNVEIKLPYSEADFETVIDGNSTRLFTLKNKNGMVVTLTNYGAKIVSVYAPDRSGNFADVVLGFKTISEYQ